MKKSHKGGNYAVKVIAAWLKNIGFGEIHIAKPYKQRLPNGTVITRSEDLFGCWDILACTDQDTVAVQVTTPSNRSARRRKIEEHTFPRAWEQLVATLERIDGANVIRVQAREGTREWSSIEGTEVDIALLLAKARVDSGRRKKRFGKEYRRALSEAKNRKKGKKPCRQPQ